MQELPGKDSHLEMLPKLPQGQPIRIQHDTAPRPGAVLIMIYEEEKELRFPLIQRPQYDGVHSGQMALPGGKKEKEDKDLVETALRETQEEIGIAPEDIEVIGSLSTFFVAASNFQILPVIGYSRTTPKFVADNHEVEEVIVASFDHLIAEEKRRETEIKVSSGLTLHSPYFELGGKTVWGATAMMLSEFRVILKEIYGTIN